MDSSPPMSLSIFTSYSFVTILTALLVVAIIKRYRFVQRCNKIIGPRMNIPLFGGTIAIFRPDEIMDVTQSLLTVWGRSTDGVMRFWIGPFPFFLITTAEAAEVILSSNRLITKSREYNFLHPWLNTGLLTSTGSKWQSRRKLLTPAFHFKILEDFITVFNEQSRILVDLLKNEAATKENNFNIFPYITRCTLDIICEAAMGRNVNAQGKTDSDYVKAVHKMSSISTLRQVRFYLQPDWMFKLTSYWPEQCKSLEILHGFTNRVVQERKLDHKKEKKNKMAHFHLDSDDGSDNSKDKDIFFSKRRRLAFLDLLIEASDDGKVLSDSDIHEEVDTIMFEGHDTTSAAIAWSLFLIGSHPEVQELVNEELISVLGNSHRPITMSDLNQLKYLESCIKEALRLYPSVPIFNRKLTEDTVINGKEIPSGQSVAICPYFLHRDPRFFPDPELFKPERFLLEMSATRHPYAYVPFSAGPRNCIGQRFALMEEKVVLASIFRNFHVTSLDKREEVVLMMELILRPRDGIRVHLVPKDT